MIRILTAQICLSGALFAAGPVIAACVENGTDEALYFTIESRTGEERIGASLAPGKALCLPGAEQAVFTAFASVHSVEGCPRVSGPDGRDRLEHFLPTDSCRWASHGQ